MTNKQEYPLHKLTNSVVLEYLEFMSETESPPIFHAWSLISAASACLGRRCWFQMGAIRIMPNQYVMLVGAPGVRKSSTISFARGILSDVAGLRFAPNNTAGRMQGLMARMIGDKKQSNADEDIDDALGNLSTNLLSGLGYEDMTEDDTNILDRHALYVMEGELASFIGIKSTDFITFLTDMWDKSGEAAYEYQLKKEAMKVPFPCLNMIGAITQMHLTTYLPPEAIGQGFMSRVVMVYAEETKKVAWPEPLDEKRKNGFKALLTQIFTQREGVFTYTQEAKQEIIRLHNRGYGQIEDARFIHYMQRRQTHMIKVAMSLCALRMSQEITEDDIIDAHTLLEMTEAKMADSLGEYGLSPVALARARVMDVLKSAREPLTSPRLALACGGDIRHSDLNKAVFELEESGTIIGVAVKDTHGGTRTAYVTHKTLLKRDERGDVHVSYSVRDSAVKAVEAAHAKSGIDRVLTPLRPKQQPQTTIDEMGETYVAPTTSDEDAENGAKFIEKGTSILDLVKSYSK